MKILITGGLGYIASHVVSLCAEHDIQPIILDDCRNSQPEVHEILCEMLGYQIPWYRGDIAKTDLIRQICREHEIAGVMHFAASKSVGESCEYPFGYYGNNVRGTIKMCQELDKHGVRTIVFSSSCTVYGMGPDVLPPYDENTTRSTTNPYGTTKLMNELMLEDLARHRDWKVMLLRYFNPIGAHQSMRLGENPQGIPSNVLPYLMRVASGEYKEFSLRGDDYATPDGTALRDYIHVMDLAQAHIVALDQVMRQEKSYCEAYNIGTGSPTSVQELLQICQEVVGHEIPYRICPRRSGDVQAAYADTSKTSRQLGRKAHYSVVQAVQDAWNYVQLTNKRETV